jgi:hypothetical protein
MKYLPTIASILLGLLFLAASVPILLHLMPEPKLPEGPILTFMTLFGTTGYMTFVKVCELVGAILVMIPHTRNFGLLILGPIVINILCFTAFIAKSAPNGLTIAVVVLAAYLLFAERKAFLGLLKS